MKYKKSISYIHKLFDTGDIIKKNTSTKTVNLDLQIKRNKMFDKANAYVFIFISCSGDKMVTSI